MHSAEHLQVVLRVRPLLGTDSAVVSLGTDNSVQVSNGDRFIESTYDQVFGEQDTQRELFEFVAPALQSVRKGFNCTVLAYGQTGSGKTHTMFGAHCEQDYFRGSAESSEGYGLVPRSILALFCQESAKQVTIYCSFLQIYNEKLFDLLQDPTRSRPLNIRENKVHGVFVEGLAEYIVCTAEECFLLLAAGERRRVVRQTKFNQHSSRGHTIFQLQLERDCANSKGLLKKGKLSLCDLSGSEKSDKENSVLKLHRREMAGINQSLSALGKVIHALAAKDTHIPYRDSKLTRLLQDALGVNTRTVLIATVSPSEKHFEETVSTLKFADRARQVLVIVRKNTTNAVSEQLVHQLQGEIQHLKALLGRHKRPTGELQQQLLLLTEENQRLKRFSKNISVASVERLKQENKRLRIELQSMSRAYEGGEGELRELNVSSTELCPQCKLAPPCIHLASSFARSVSYSTNSSIRPEAPRSRLLNVNKLNVRYKMTPPEDASTAKLKEEQGKQKELREIRSRLAKISQLEVYRKTQFRKELEKLEEHKRTQEEEHRRRASQQHSRCKVLAQKRAVREYKELKQQETSLQLERLNE